MALLDLRSLVESGGVASPVNNTRPVTIKSRNAGLTAGRDRTRVLTLVATATIQTRARTLTLFSQATGALLSHKVAGATSRARLMPVASRDKANPVLPHKQSYLTSRDRNRTLTTSSSAQPSSR